MKTINRVVLLILPLVILACNSDNSNTEINNESDINLTGFIYKIYDPSTLEILEQTTYSLQNNKIVSSTYYSNINNSTINSTYTYSNSKISEIISYENNEMIGIINYNYDSNNRLSEYILQADTLELSSYDKHTFTYTQDTIYVARRRSTDGINYDLFVSDMKTILDDNDNRIYFETIDHLYNLPKSIVKNTYDSNNNLATEETSIYFNELVPYVSTNAYDYNTNINTLQLIYNETFGRKNSMLLYHLEPLQVFDFNFNPRFISPSSVSNFNPSWGSEADPIIILENIFDDNGISMFDDYQVFSGNSIDYFYRFTLEYFFE